MTSRLHQAATNPAGWRLLHQKNFRTCASLLLAWIVEQVSRLRVAALSENPSISRTAFRGNHLRRCRSHRPPWHIAGLARPSADTGRAPSPYFAQNCRNARHFQYPDAANARNPVTIAICFERSNHDHHLTPAMHGTIGSRMTGQLFSDPDMSADDALALDLVLGVLRTSDRDRAEQRFRNEPPFAALVSAHRTRLYGTGDYAAGTPPNAVKPRVATWDAIKARLPGSTTD